MCLKGGSDLNNRVGTKTLLRALSKSAIQSTIQSTSQIALTEPVSQPFRAVNCLLACVVVTLSLFRFLVKGRD